MCKKTVDVATPTSSLWSFESIVWNKKAYAQVASEFHPYHKHDLNVAMHVVTTGMGMWGAIQLLAEHLELPMLVYVYTGIIALTTPWLWTATLHTLFVIACRNIPTSLVMSVLSIPEEDGWNPIYVCLAVIAAGYGLQDIAHWLCCEKTMMSSYISSNPSMLLLHTLWLMPLVIDSVIVRAFFFPKLLVNRNRNLFVQVASRKAVEDIRAWINTNVPETPETTHVWPHQHEGTDGPVTQLEDDAAIMAGFRKVFATHHFDVQPVLPMNEIYITAVGAKREINSDAVFYTPHTDGPYWWLPGASLYRVLVGVTPNTMVRTRFNMQHETQDKVVDMYDVLGFDYNRELHWIDHVPGQVNQERRSLIKLHFVVYPKGWHRYGQLAAKLNASYNTWARNNFLRTLRPKGLYETGMAWWIWVTTWSNALLEAHIGWPNMTYVLGSYLAFGLTTPFVILTSFRHYLVYIATFAYRQPPVAHGALMRDAKLYKTLALMHMSKRLLPLIDLRGTANSSSDLVGILLATIGFSITILATMQLGMVRTYFGSELGYVKPKWISGFPYGTIPHPMIVGQLMAWGSIIFWFYDRMTTETLFLTVGHIGFYTLHMIQEILYSSY